MISQGKVIIPFNPNHSPARPAGIGFGLRTKVNVNIGTSADFPRVADELKKVDIAVRHGADAIMDLSTGGDIRKIRRRILARSPFPLGTVPIYQAAISAIARRGSIIEMTVDDLFAAIEAQAREGVDFVTVHCGLTQKAIDRLKKQGRVADIVSRGGAFHLAWMLHHGQENPLYANYDRLLDLARRYDVTLSLGDGLRPGSIIDATDRPQIEELLTLGELVERAWEAGVQVMVEGPGHVPLDQIEMNIKLQKRVCHGAPFYVLGPLVTDIAPGYDHIVSAIGGAIAALGRRRFPLLCDAGRASRPALDRGRPRGAHRLQDRGPRRRHRQGRQGRGRPRPRPVPGPEKARLAPPNGSWSSIPINSSEIRKKRKTKSAACSMCGEYCAMRIVSQFLKSKGKADDFCF